MRHAGSRCMRTVTEGLRVVAGPLPLLPHRQSYAVAYSFSS